jgi:hemerythrin-like domain-containing protein
MVRLLDALREDHANMAKLLDAFEHQLAIFEKAEGPDYDVIDGVIEYCLTYPDLYHHPMEDLLIARLSCRDPGRLAELGDLREEHVALSALARRLAAAVRHVRLGGELSRNDFSALAGAFVHLYRWHMDREERFLFPAAREALTAEDWAQIEGEVPDVPDLLFGSKRDRRFAALRNSILAWAAWR